MKAEFYKMQSLGNDYIYFDLVTKRVSKKMAKYLVDNASQIAVNVCKRKFSLGGDGIVLILPNPNYDATMIIYNSDGSRAKMCGNALRAVGYLLASLNKSHQQLVETDSGLRRVYINENSVMAQMGRAKFIPFSLDDFSDIRLTTSLKSALHFDLVSVGNTHLAVMLKDQKDVDFRLIAPLLSKNLDVNVEFFTIIDGKICARVYERGSGETLSCGTGACAVVASAVKNRLIDYGKTKVRFGSGELFVEINKDFTMLLGGEVKFVCEGWIDV